MLITAAGHSVVCPVPNASDHVALCSVLSGGAVADQPLAAANVTFHDQDAHAAGILLVLKRAGSEGVEFSLLPREVQRELGAMSRTFDICSYWHSYSLLISQRLISSQPIGSQLIVTLNKSAETMV